MMGWSGASAARVCSSVEYWPVLVFFASLLRREFAEEDFAELLGRADVEGNSGVLINGGFEARDVGAQFFTDLLERDGVEADAFVFHGGQDGQKRRFDFDKDFFLARFLELRLEEGVELEGEVGAFHGPAGAELRGVGRLHLREKILLAGGFFLQNGRVVEE